MIVEGRGGDYYRDAFPHLSLSASEFRDPLANAITPRAVAKNSTTKGIVIIGVVKGGYHWRRGLQVLCLESSN